ncbi:MAG: energy transducer TonB [Acidobacteriaceae bacterium]|nr:energy transducer TonB [Acidobacteriaceae bacterium]
MPSMPQQAQFALLPEPPPPWTQFVLSMGVQTLSVMVLAWLAVLHPAILRPPAHDSHFVPLVSTPAVINHEPAPVSVFQKPQRVARLVVPRELPAPVEHPQPKLEIDPPSLPAESQQLALAPAAPVVPRALVKTDVFSTGSSAAPTLPQAPRNVQTGGFGDPNGVAAMPTSVRPTTIAKSGAFDLPTGPGNGNGTGGARGVRGVVASAGFGSGLATGDGSGNLSASRGNGTIRQGAFSDANGPVATPVRSKARDDAAKTLPAEILSKPSPTYTEEARKLRVEGEVLLEVLLEASGQLRVVRVVRGLGHGLDESAIHAAEQIRFKPAVQNGQPTDSTTVLHIIFQLA